MKKTIFVVVTVVAIAVVGVLFLKNRSSKNAVSKEDSPSEIILKNYFAALAKGDFDKSTSFLSDNVLVSNGSSASPKNKEFFHNRFQWDSVLSTNYKLIEFKNTDKGLLITMSRNCKFTTFLLGDEMKFKVRYKLTNDKIYSEEVVEMIGVNQGLMTDNWKSLTIWVKVNQPNSSELFTQQLIQNKANAEKILKIITAYNGKSKN